MIFYSHRTCIILTCNCRRPVYEEHRRAIPSSIRVSMRPYGEACETPFLAFSVFYPVTHIPMQNIRERKVLLFAFLFMILLVGLRLTKEVSFCKYSRSDLYIYI